MEQVFFRIARGQLESSLSGYIIWNDGDEGLDEENSPCGIGQVIQVNCWEVIRGGDGLGELTDEKNLNYSKMLE